MLKLLLTELIEAGHGWFRNVVDTREASPYNRSSSQKRGVMTGKAEQTGDFEGMSDDTYTPQPLDTSRIQLSDEIAALVEVFAENNHEIWARERVNQGWKHGPTRDDVKREHPCLLPFKDLPESEKAMDRKAAIETIKTLVSLGYRKDPAVSDALFLDQKERERQAAELLAEIKRPKITTAELRQLWKQRIPLIWSTDVEIYRRATDVALKLGEGFLAFDIADEGLGKFEGNLRLLQLQALALARTGATRRANDILEQLSQSGHKDEETLGILARTYKDFWNYSNDPDERREHLRRSFELYKDSYERNGGYYSGINAATTGLLFGDKEEAQRLATEVSEICSTTLEFISPDSGERYWLEATLAEALLIRGDFPGAEAYYRRGSTAPDMSTVVVSRTRGQARMILEHLGEDIHRLDDCFHLPRIAVFSGHMFDKANREHPRFPHCMEEAVRREIDDRLVALNIRVGYASLACGGDLIFAEALLARGGEINIVLPFKVEDFKKASVDLIPGMDWGKRFDEILHKAATVTVLSELGDPDDPAAFEFCNRAISGLALLKSQFLGMDVTPLFVWDGKEGDGVGGTQSHVDYWEQDLGIDVEVIKLTDLYEECGVDVNATCEVSAAPVAPAGGIQETAHPESNALIEVKQEIKAMVFADVVGFTKLHEIQIPSFVEHFLGQVAEIMFNLDEPPTHHNTWGDAVMCVFDSVAGAGIFALKLRDLVRGSDWSQWGLPELSIRIALHCGPVFPCHDPVLKKRTYNGAHVNRTARIEPVAEEGQIYASEAFAAIATAESVKEFVCDYVGTRQLAKKYGAIPVFLVRELVG